MNKEETTKVQVIELQGVKLRPGAKYIFAYDARFIIPDRVHKVIAWAQQNGIPVMPLPCEGNPSDLIKTYEVMPEEDKK